jgi:hypothetical protein
MKETTLMREFMHRAAVALPMVRLFRRNVAVIKIDNRAIRAGLKGQADLYGYIRGGRVIEIEIKARRGVLTPEQIVWQGWCREWGIPHLVLWIDGHDPVTRWLEEVADAIRV